LAVLSRTSYYSLLILFPSAPGALSSNYKEYTREELVEFINERIYDPRSELLDAMRSGFNMVSIRSHLISFTPLQFEEYFVGVEIFTAMDVISCLIFKCDNEFEVIQDQFKAAVEQAIVLLADKKHTNLTEFVKFISGSSVLQVTRKLIVTPFSLSHREAPHWPEYPLPKAQTCFSTLVVPYLLDSHADNGTDTDSGDGNSRGWCAENVLRSFELMLCFNNEAFSDS
jgi:HECT-domain (ubiquitin-transferase)